VMILGPVGAVAAAGWSPLTMLTSLEIKPIEVVDSVRWKIKKNKYSTHSTIA
jgi:hypothetical protein